MNEDQLLDCAHLLCDPWAERELDRAELLNLEGCSLGSIEAAEKSPGCAWMLGPPRGVLEEFRGRIRDRRYKPRSTPKAAPGRGDGAA
jgi:hypothetical protein